MSTMYIQLYNFVFLKQMFHVEHFWFYKIISLPQNRSRLTLHFIKNESPCVEQGIEEAPPVGASRLFPSAVKARVGKKWSVTTVTTVTTKSACPKPEQADSSFYQKRISLRGTGYRRSSACRSFSPFPERRKSLRRKKVVRDHRDHRDHKISLPQTGAD